MSAILSGCKRWSCERDQDGHREYTLDWQVYVTDTADGPFTVLNCPGLPAIGAQYALGNDLDPWAYCWPTTSVWPVVDSEQTDLWMARTIFSTKPFRRCQDNAFQSPFSEPPRLGGSWVKFTKRAAFDLFGNRVENPAHEPLDIEVDDNRPTVTVGLNLPILPLASYSAMIDHVNDGPLWGLPARCVKLGNVRWGRQVYGTCSYYYTVDYEFEIKFDTWDFYKYNDASLRLRDMDLDHPDPPDPANPADFTLITDSAGNVKPGIIKEDGTLWRGVGLDGPAPYRSIYYYPGANLYELGIPASL